MTARLLFIFILLILSRLVFGQIEISGTIKDHFSNPVSYAAITTGDKKSGTVSQINGKFSLTLSAPDTVHIFYLGLKPYSFFVDKSRSYEIKMRPKSYQLEEVVVFPGINPADTIMEHVIDLRDKHDPYNLPSFSYTAYNKFKIEINRDTLVYLKSQGPISTNANLMIKLADTSNVFLSEAISEYYYKKPGKTHENILTTNISGFKNPAFALLGSQLHSLSCYDDFFTIGNLKYVNPVSRNAPKKYLFLLKDTLVSNNGTDIFVITFRPKPGTTFRAMYGMLYIDAKEYAVRRIVAQPASQTEQFGITVRQEYHKLFGEHWFPRKLQSRINFQDKVVDSLPPLPVMIGFASTDIINPKIGVEIPKKILRRQFALNYDDDAGTTNDSLLNKYRTDTLTAKDLYTFELMDSITSQVKMFKWLESLPQMLATGEIPLGYITLNLEESLDFNKQERYRYGLSVMTSEKVLKWIRFGGKVLRASKPGEQRYAARVYLNPFSSGIARLKYEYHEETSEKGAYHFYNPYKQGYYNLRRFIFDELNYVTGHQAAFELEYPRFLNVRAMAFIENYKLSHTARDTIFGDFKRNALRIDLRYAPGENLTNMGKFRIRNSAGGPVFNLSYEQGFNIENTDIAYQRYMGRFIYNYPTRFLGTFRIMSHAGLIQGDIPLEMAFSGRGSAQLHVYEQGVFQTMPVYRYFHTRFANAFVQHYLPLHDHKHNLMFSITSQFGMIYGESSGSRIRLLAEQATKGLYEAGIMGGILSPDVGQIMIGTFYKMGAYTSAKQIDNFSLVIGLSASLDW